MRITDETPMTTIANELFKAISEYAYNEFAYYIGKGEQNDLTTYIFRIRNNYAHKTKKVPYIYNFNTSDYVIYNTDLEHFLNAYKQREEKIEQDRLTYTDYWSYDPNTDKSELIPSTPWLLSEMKECFFNMIRDLMTSGAQNTCFQFIYDRYISKSFDEDTKALLSIRRHLQQNKK